MNENALTVTETAKILRITTRTVQRKIKSGELKGTRVGVRSFRILRKDLDEYLEKLNGRKILNELLGD